MNNLPIFCLGVNHRTAPIAVREQLSCTLTELLPHLPHAAASEVVLISTCNRLEIYICGPQSSPVGLAPDMFDALSEALAQTVAVNKETIIPCLESRSGWAAAEHLYRVATGLDSLVLGEPQILGQVTHAYETATALDTAGPVLKALFQGAIRAGKRARTETAISHNPASISSVALNLVHEQLGQLTEKQVVVVGLGQMGQLTVKALRARGVRQVTLINRGRVRAEALAQQYNYQWLPLEQLPQALVLADVVISATHAHQPLITQAMMANGMNGRASRPLIALDLAIPRDIEPAAAAVPGVKLYDLDDLRSNLDEALLARQREIPPVETIIAEELAQLATTWQVLPFHPLISDLRQKAERIRERELIRTRRHLKDVDPQVWEQIQHLSRALVNQILHEPTIRLRQKATTPQADAYASAVRDLFNLYEG
jgi:glutamyl-tRNA reductase